MLSTFAPSHRGGSGPPLVLLHGFTDTMDAAGFDAARIGCPVGVVWGTEDRILPWPSAAARFREDWLPHADWVELDGVGHCPQLDVPLETAQLALGFTAR